MPEICTSIYRIGFEEDDAEVNRMFAEGWTIREQRLQVSNDFDGHWGLWYIVWERRKAANAIRDDRSTPPDPLTVSVNVSSDDLNGLTKGLREKLRSLDLGATNTHIDAIPVTLPAEYDDIPADEFNDHVMGRKYSARVELAAAKVELAAAKQDRLTLSENLDRLEQHNTELRTKVKLLRDMLSERRGREINAGVIADWMADSSLTTDTDEK